MDSQSSKNYFPSIAITFFVLAGLVLLLTPKTFWPGFYDLPYLGWAALACAGLVAFAPRRFQVPLAAILFLNATGDMGLYELYRVGFEYDKLIHFATPMVATVALARALPIRRTIFLVVIGAVGWELYEYLADTFLKTHLFGVYRHQILRDTLVDLSMNLLGILAALCYTGLSYGRPGNLNQSRTSV